MFRSVLQPLRTPLGPDLDFSRFVYGLWDLLTLFGDMFMTFWDLGNPNVAVWVPDDSGLVFVSVLGLEITPEPDAWTRLNHSKYVCFHTVPRFLVYLRVWDLQGWFGISVWKVFDALEAYFDDLGGS